MKRFEPSPSPSRILIVDDDPLSRAIQMEILSSSRFVVVEACNGMQALAALHPPHDFDLVLLDRHMPQLSGDEVCRRLRQELGETMLPVIMITTDSRSEDLASALKAGATDFIHKPFHPIECLARIEAALEHRRLIVQLDHAESVLFALARMVEAKDENTGNHCARLAHHALVFGQHLGLSHDELTALRRGGVLHDIGKLGIPDSILLKPGQLAPDEWMLMQSHTVIGAQLCSSLKSMRLTVPIIRSHHERWDGSGYPDRLKGTEIPLLARVFQLIDIYDALTYARPYKPALKLDEVIRILERECQQGWRDPELCGEFLSLLRTHPELFDGHGVPLEDEALGGRVFHRSTQSPFHNPYSEAHRDLSSR